MANELFKNHTVVATVTMTATTALTTVAIPAGAIITSVSMFNNALLVGAGNVTVNVDGTAVTAVTAAVLTNANLCRFVLAPALGANAGTKTTISTNGGYIGYTSSVPAGSVDIIISYLL